jgi:hypothetical protein
MSVLLVIGIFHRESAESFAVSATLHSWIVSCVRAATLLSTAIVTFKFRQNCLTFNLLSHAKVGCGKYGLVVVILSLDVSRDVWCQEEIVLFHCLWNGVSRGITGLFVLCTNCVTLCPLCNGKIVSIIYWWFSLQNIKPVSIKFCTYVFPNKCCLLLYSQNGCCSNLSRPNGSLERPIVLCYYKLTTAWRNTKCLRSDHTV